MYFFIGNFFKKNHLKELIAISAIFLVVSAASYFVFLNKTLNQFQLSKKNLQKQSNILQQKKFLATSDIQNLKKLNSWQQQHPNFYCAISTSQTADQLLQLATHLAEQSGFSIMQAAPVIDLNHHKKNTRDHFIQLQLSGTYQDLFYFLHQLNHSPWSFLLNTLSIPHPKQFDLKLSVRGSGD